MVVRRLGAFAVLGFRAIGVHPLQLLFRGRSRNGREAFLRNYAPEGLIPLTAPERSQLITFMRCVDCGMCDAVCPLVGRLERRDFAGPSLVALAYARATPDLGIVASTLAHLPADCGACTKCVDVCPTRVPLRELFSFANRKLQEVVAARSAGVPTLPAPAGSAEANG
jgi:NAD-dependent dihydropyrimidine dehydrogenase PreA subunit